VLITHVPPWYDSARVLKEALVAFAGPLELARTGGVYEV
jgi:hypothetical protein